MNQNNLLEESQSYVRMAIPLMTKHSVPITPENYAVWYKYVSGANSDLNRTIDSICAKGKPFNAETNEVLHRQFCAEGNESELKKLRVDLRQIMITILMQIADLTGQTHKYEKFISKSIDKLNGNISVDDIKKIIIDLLAETQTIGKVGKSIQNELKETTQALETLKQELEQAKIEALVDFLTGIPNRKAFQGALVEAIQDAVTQNKPLSLLLLDIDHFKKFNDQFGHLIGDEVIRFVAKKIKDMVRGNDYLARFGGEEFAVILPHTPVMGAEVVAEAIVRFFAHTKMKTVSTAKNIGIITLSIGVACFRHGESSEDFISRADQALYIAKTTGRNRVATETALVSHETGNRHIGVEAPEIHTSVH